MSEVELYAPDAREMGILFQIFRGLAKKFPDMTFVTSYDIRDRLLNQMTEEQMFVNYFDGPNAIAMCGCPVIPRADLPPMTFYMVLRGSLNAG